MAEETGSKILMILIPAIVLAVLLLIGFTIGQPIGSIFSFSWQENLLIILIVAVVVASYISYTFFS